MIRNCLRERKKGPQESEYYFWYQRKAEKLFLKRKTKNLVYLGLLWKKKDLKIHQRRIQTESSLF